PPRRTSSPAPSLHDALPISLPRFRRPVQHLGLPTGGVDELFTRRALRAQPPAGNRRIRISFDLDDLFILNEDLLPAPHGAVGARSEEHTSELQSRFDLVCRL